MTSALTIRAGETARRILHERGWSGDEFTSLVGASGGPKWLVLSQMDRVLCGRLLAGRTRPLHLIGSSIGSFRHACFAQADPLGAIERFENAYIEQAYDRPPTPAEVTAESRRILGVLLGPRGTKEILSNPVVQSHVIAVRSRGPVAQEERRRLAIGLAAAATANALHRRALGAFFQRTVFHSGEVPSFEFDDGRARAVALEPDNLADALVASGSIPLVMAGVRDIAGAPPGLYRDGGIVDYHFDFRFRAPRGLVLYPHFFEHITPGWFDKALSWRRPRRADLDRVVLLAPSPTFVAALPRGRVPDRTDFRALPTRDRQRDWRAVVDACRRLADEVEALFEGGFRPERVESFP